MITITSLIALLLLQIVIVTYLYCDKLRAEEFNSVQPDLYQFPQAAKASRTINGVSLIKLD